MTEAETPKGGGGEGRHLSPLGLFVGFITGIPQLIFPMFAAMYGTRGSGFSMPLIVLGVLSVALFFRWIAWLRFRYYIDEDDIRIEHGILNRTARSIPFDRIQDVSIEQKLLARLLGLGEVKFETGGGDGGDDARLSFVNLDEAQRLRETIKARKGVPATAPVTGTESEPAPVFAMDNRRLVTLGLYSFSLVIFAVLGGLAQQFDFLLPFDFWDFRAWIGIAEDRGVSIDTISMSARIVGALAALVGLILIGFASGIARTFIKEYGFRLDRNEKGFRRRRGLFTHTDVVMPVHRVQAAIIATGPIRKRRGWHALKFVSLAKDSKEDSDHMVAPLATLAEIWPIMAEAKLSAPGTDVQFNAVHRGPWIDQWLLLTLVIVFVAGGLYWTLGTIAWLALGMPVLLAILFWLDWHHRSDAIDATQLFARHGWWRQQLDIARKINVQSVTIRQGPLTRRRGLAEIEFGIAGGRLSFAAMPIDAAYDVRDRVMAFVAPVDFSELNRTD